MSSLFKAFKTDATKETEGVLIRYGANDDGSIPSFRVMRRGPTNQRYSKTLASESKPYRRQLELGTLDERVSKNILLNVFLIAVLVGWENVQGEDGKVIPYNRQNAVELFEKLPELYADLSDQAAKLENFRVDELDSTAKNS